MQDSLRSSQGFQVTDSMDLSLIPSLPSLLPLWSCYYPPLSRVPLLAPPYFSFFFVIENIPCAVAHGLFSVGELHPRQRASCEPSELIEVIFIISFLVCGNQTSNNLRASRGDYRHAFPVITSGR